MGSGSAVVRPVFAEHSAVCRQSGIGICFHCLAFPSFSRRFGCGGGAAVWGDVGEIHHQAVGGFDGFLDFVRACPQCVVFTIGCFVCGCFRLGDDAFRSPVDGKIFEFGLRLEGFGVVQVELRAASDGAEYVYVHEYVGIRQFVRHDFDAAQEKYGLYQVA